ncbi:unnamed protein product [Peronospora belbahrii]|uniref:RNase III domain-containing protein n=1 Tax=Peronospora belbahrii TaxID=622444 RepID=A0AAU9KJL8_9STRA|nr:unnamed protein product [Peronospora belbahrii]CAH0520529.1 unnamed protein product [Peronospora belbahrii]
MTKKRRKVHTYCRRSISESDNELSVKRSKYCMQESNGLKLSKSGESPETVAHFQAFQRSPALTDVFEWLGDALLGELVGRCLLSQFHHSPLSARVFRNLRLAVVSNRNLAQVYDAMGYGTVERCENVKKCLKMKEKADVVEAIVGELVLKLHQQKIPTEEYRAHLDAVLAMMLHTHFTDRIKARKEQDETRMTVKGPLSVSFNPFTCLPMEQLDAMTGELVVMDGIFDYGDQEERVDANVIYEYKENKQTGTTIPHHFFADVSTIFTGKKEQIQDKTLSVDCIKDAMIQLNQVHILRTSNEIFQIFKTYGMAVLSERISLSLVLPHLSLGFHQHSKRYNIITPATLTRQRQLVLSMANLAACAIHLEIASPVAHDVDIDGEGEVAAWRLQEEHGLANTLRAFVGYHSAIGSTTTSATYYSSELVDTVCTSLYDAAFPSQKEFSGSVLRLSRIPEREPLMVRSVSEARMFMNSKTCDDLHKRGERPVADTALKCDEKQKLCVLLRQCYSNKLEDLFGQRNEKQKLRRKESEPAPVSQTRQKKKAKKKQLADSFAATAGCITRNLERFLHRRFLFCLEEIVILFAQHKTEACRGRITAFEHDLIPCTDQSNFRKWVVSASTLTLAMRDGFFRMLLHDICQFHAIISSSRNTQDGHRITQLRLPLHYTWANINTRITSKHYAVS